MSLPLAVDPTNPKEMAIFAAACVLAKHLQYGAAEAFYPPIEAHVTPVSLWTQTKGLQKDFWIARAMEALRLCDPAPMPRTSVVVTGLQPGPNGNKVIGTISPQDVTPLCIYCNEKPAMAGSDYCGNECVINSQNEGA